MSNSAQTNAEQWSQHFYQCHAGVDKIKASKNTGALCMMSCFLWVPIKQIYKNFSVYSNSNPAQYKYENVLLNFINELYNTKKCVFGCDIYSDMRDRFGTGHNSLSHHITVSSHTQKTVTISMYSLPYQECKGVQ